MLAPTKTSAHMKLTAPMLYIATCAQSIKVSLCTTVSKYEERAGRCILTCITRHQSIHVQVEKLLLSRRTNHHYNSKTSRSRRGMKKSSQGASTEENIQPRTPSLKRLLEPAENPLLPAKKNLLPITASKKRPLGPSSSGRMPSASARRTLTRSTCPRSGGGPGFKSQRAHHLYLHL